MKSKTYLILFLIFFGEALIVLGFLHFCIFVQPQVLALNIAVISFIFLIYMTRLLQSGHDLRGRSDKGFAGMGIRGYALIAYGVAAIGAMYAMNGILPQSFLTQLLIQAGFLFLLGLLLYFSAMAVDKAGQVHEEQSVQRIAIENVRRKASVIAEKALRSDLPQSQKNRICEIVADMRYLTPGNSAESSHLETLLLAELERLDPLLSIPASGVVNVTEIILNIESLYRQRKQVYAY
jgi:hypothetical protein